MLGWLKALRLLEKGGFVGLLYMRVIVLEIGVIYGLLTPEVGGASRKHFSKNEAGMWL